MKLFSLWGNRSKAPTQVRRELIEAARDRIRPILPITLLSHSHALSDLVGHEIRLKWDNMFKTGSFKERGACNFVEQLTPAERKRGLCAASAGNHAMALSLHAARLSIPCTIVMPVSAPLVKVQSTEDFGAKVILYGATFNDAYDHALRLAKEQNLVFVSAFDDPAIICGQGTCGLEILEQWPDLDSIVVPIGGGGLISGIAAAIKSVRPEIFILGVQSEWTVKSRQGTLPTGLLAPRSIADGIAVKREGLITKPLMEELVDKVVALSEEQLCDSTVRMLELEKSVVEGAGAAGVGAILNNQLPDSCRRTVAVVTGSNIDINVLARLIQRNLARDGRLLRATVSAPDRPGMLHRALGSIAGQGGNVLEVVHSRQFTGEPGSVEITFIVEVRSKFHGDQIRAALAETGVQILSS